MVSTSSVNSVTVKSLLFIHCILSFNAMYTLATLQALANLFQLSFHHLHSVQLPYFGATPLLPSPDLDSTICALSHSRHTPLFQALAQQLPTHTRELPDLSYVFHTPNFPTVWPTFDRSDPGSRCPSGKITPAGRFPPQPEAGTYRKNPPTVRNRPTRCPSRGPIFDALILDSMLRVR